VQQFKYIKNIEGNEGTILLYNQIGDSIDENGNTIYGISGSSFAYEMQYLASKCNKINVRINSIGGSVFEGYSIVSSILNSTCKVHCYVDGLAASMAGIIAVSGEKCYMMDYSTLMLHNPSGGDKKILALIKETLVTILSNRTKMSAEDIDSMMSKETWINAKDALEQGLVDEVVSSGKKLKMKKNETLSNMVLIYNKLLTINKMIKVTNHLQLKEDASEQEILNAIESKEAENTTLKNELAELKKQLADIAAEKAEQERLKNEKRKSESTLMVENAIKLGKLKPEDKDATILNASKDDDSFAFVKGLIDRLGNGKESHKPFDIKNFSGKNGSVEDRSTWSYRDWETKDVEGLKNMYANNPEQYEELLKTNKKSKITNVNN